MFLNGIARKPTKRKSNWLNERFLNNENNWTSVVAAAVVVCPKRVSEFRKGSTSVLEVPFGSRAFEATHRKSNSVF